MILGMLINAISMGEVIIPNMPKIMLSTPAVYSFWRQASKPNIKASGLKSGDKIKIPMNPNMMPRVP